MCYESAAAADWGAWSTTSIGSDDIANFYSCGVPRGRLESWTCAAGAGEPLLLFTSRQTALKVTVQPLAWAAGSA